MVMCYVKIMLVLTLQQHCTVENIDQHADILGFFTL